MSSAAKPSVCIVMATHNPEPRFFRKQVESIRTQSHSSWSCLIQDDGSSEEAYREIRREIGTDSRFGIHRNRQRLGVYHCFEMALAGVTKSTDLVCLADQDDIWLPHKVERLAGEFADPSVQLVHSDLSVIDECDAVTHPSCWALEKRNVHNARSIHLLLLRNVVTGCASMLRRDLLDTALPFPAQGVIPAFFHDLWLALIASARGKIVSLPEPLVLYRSHSGNTLGPLEKGLVRDLRKFAAGYPRYLSREYLDETLRHSRQEWDERRELSVALRERLRLARSRGTPVILPRVDLFNTFPDFGVSSLVLTGLSLAFRHHALAPAVRLCLGKAQRDLRLSSLIPSYMDPPCSQG